MKFSQDKPSKDRPGSNTMQVQSLVGSIERMLTEFKFVQHYTRFVDIEARACTLSNPIA